MACAILFFAFMGLLNVIVLPLGSLVSDSLSQLADARFRLAHLEAIKARPEPPEITPLPSQTYLTAENEAEAIAQLQTRLTALAAQFQLRLDAISAAQTEPPKSGRIALSLGVIGAQDQVLSFVNSLEREQPLVRLRTWRLARETGAPPNPATPQAPVPVPASPSPPQTPIDPNAGAGIGTATASAGAPPAGQPMGGQAVRLDAVVVSAWTRLR